MTMHDTASDGFRKRHRLPPCRRCVAIVLILIASLYPSIGSAQERTTAAPGALRDLEIFTKGGIRTFMVEIANTRQQRDIGLMFRNELPNRQGMLFDFGRDQPVKMWMKDTLIPLDMLFIERTGTIHRIVHNAHPESLELISSKGAVRWVLELNAGTSKTLGITVGDRITGPFGRP